MSTAPAQPPVKSQPLHKFALPFLKWGVSGKNHHTNAAHHHRCRRPSSHPSDHASEPDSDPHSRPHCLGSRTNRNRFALPTCSLKPLAPPPQPLQAPSCNDETNDEAAKRDIEDAEEAVQKPWNLRPRKPALPKSALEIGTGPSRNHANNGAGEFHDAISNHGENLAPKSLRLRVFADTQCAEKKEKRKFWIAKALFTEGGEVREEVGEAIGSVERGGDENECGGKEEREALAELKRVVKELREEDLSMRRIAVERVRSLAKEDAEARANLAMLKTASRIFECLRVDKGKPWLISSTTLNGQGPSFMVAEMKDFKIWLKGTTVGRKGRLAITAMASEVASEVVVVESKGEGGRGDEKD
ncbi:uncharacterized protein LOC124843909 [Vigna umbellata]|uniref:uncharacterized protein LOC124843909 n=1 Tax=Vigna umbellata TaxID=87088 RepID=UPI001F5FD9CE|nr:uncharacterized protein LOC124843909 [Vigna umbellata]